MSRQNRQEESENRTQWSNLQVGILVTMALVFGGMFGYLYHGTATGTQPAEVAAAPPAAPAGMPQSPPNMDALAAQLLATAQQNPKDPSVFIQLGDLYSDHKQYAKSIEYYGKALELRPDDVNVRTDMGTALWYSGDANKALAEYEKSLKVNPKHPQTLFNVGIVKWQGLNDVPGAIAAWKKLLELNPDFPQRDKVEHLIQQVAAAPAAR
jgi:cytochrome c-type biogenesis protein CcmH/NrfG